jgi:hypothetical protein
VLPFTDDTTVAMAGAIIDSEFACTNKNTLNISVAPFSYPCGPTDTSCCAKHIGTSISLGLQYDAMNVFVLFSLLLLYFYLYFHLSI